MIEEPNHVQRVLYCNNCGEDMIQHGIIERTYGGTSETHILFDPGDDPATLLSDTEIANVLDQEVYCKKCGIIFCQGEVPAWEILNFYMGETEYLESYVESMGGAPVPSIQ